MFYNKIFISKIMDLKKSLIINTTLVETSIAYVDGDNDIHVEKFETDNQIDCKIVLAYQSLLKKFGDLEINNIIVGEGPGYFTGMRLGVAFANSLKICDKFINVFSYSNFSVIETNFTDADYVLIDTKSKDIYCKNVKTGDVSLIGIDELSKNKKYVGCGGEKFHHKFEEIKNYKKFIMDINKIYEYCKNNELKQGVELSYIKSATNIKP